MKPSKFFLFAFSFIFSVSAFAQTVSGNLENDPAQIVAQKRAALIKADILREIQTFSRQDQAYFYAQFGNTLWNHDKKEALQWFTKAVEIGSSPTTEYEDGSKKLSALLSLLSRVLKKDAALEDKLLLKIKEIKIDESNLEILEDANKTYILIAQHILFRKGDENLAFEFAMLSLRGKKPAINHHSVRFILELKAKNESLGNAYFAKLIEAAQNTGRVGFAVGYLFEHDFDTYSKIWRQTMSDSQIRIFLELMLPYIQKETEAVGLKQKNDCRITKDWGLKNLEIYKRLLPEKSPLVEKAVEVCQNAEIEPWNKPDFQKRPRKTVQDWLNLAKEITDKKIQARYLLTAASLARNEKKHRLSLGILNGIEKEFRDSSWIQSKTIVTAKLIEELFNTDDFPEIEAALTDLPQEYHPFVIVDGLSSLWKIEPHQKDFVLNLMKRARAGFNKIEKLSLNPPDYAANPTKFGQLTQFYIRFGLDDEAITTHEESIKSFNRIFNNLPSEIKKRGQFPFPRNSSFSRFDNRFPRNETDFFDRYFDRIYENIGKLENPRIRLFERLEILTKSLPKAPGKDLVPGIPRSVK